MNSRNFYDRLRIAANQNIKEKKYWKTQFTGEPKKSSFCWNGKISSGTKDKKTAIKKFASTGFTLSGELFQKLIKLANNVDMKLYMVLVAGLVATLYRYTGDHDIIIGTTISRQEKEIDFINTVLALRNHIYEDTCFKDLLLQVRQTILEAIEHQNYPIEVLIEDLNMNVTEDEFPLFDILLLLESIHDKKYIRNISYNMLFCFKIVDSSLRGAIEYNSAVFDKEKIDRIIERYILLLEEMISKVDTRISEIEILSPAGKNRILDEFNDTDIPYPSEKMIYELFEDRVMESPGNTALLFEDIQLSYSELNKKADQLSRKLRFLLKPSTVVGIMVNPSLEMIIGILGILKSGGAFLPIDVNFPRSRITFMLKDSGAKILLTTADLSGSIDYPLTEINLEDEEIYNNDKGGTEPGPVSSPQDPAYIIYTSGTTGRPKGVVVEHRSVVAYLFAFFREFEITLKDIIIQNASYSFDVFVEELFPILIKGGKIAIPGLHVRENFYLLSDFIRKVNATIIDCTPMVLNELNNLDTKNGLRTYISGGDILRNHHVSNLLKTGDVYNTYGPTETTICAAYYKCSNDQAPGIPIGRPIGNYKLYILDKNNRLVPTGIPGELCISGCGVTRGYLNGPGLTAEKFVDNPYPTSSALRLYRTGDLAMWCPDGNIDFLGRVDDQVNIRGYRIELKEIENKLLKHDRIRDVVVLEKVKDENSFLCAYYVSESEIEKSELQMFAVAELPDYMVPTFFVFTEKFPLTPGGKLDKKKLREMDISRSGEYAAPGNEIEKTLVEIWADVLKLGKETISVTANFFELGGHSLSATIVIARIHKALDVKVPLIEMFRFQTVRELSLYIEAAEETVFVSIKPVEKKEYYVLSSAQKRLYSVQQLDPDSTAYNLTFGYYLGEGVLEEKIKEPFLKLINRHEVLRSSFESINNETVQRIHGEVEFEFEIHHMGNQGAGSEKSREITKNFKRAFDLSEAPLFRAGLITTRDRRFILLVELHHIIIDDACTDILTRELIDFYLGEELPHLKIQYKDYAEWQYRLASSKEMRKQEEFWLECYAGGVPLLELRTDFERPEIYNFEGSRVYLEIREDITLKLKKEILKHGANINIFLAVFNILLAKLCDQEDIIVGIPVSGRTHVDLQGIVGMFLNMLAIRNRPAGNKTYYEFIKEVEENSLQALDNQDFQFDELVEKLDFQRKPGRNPLVDVILVVLDRDESLGKVREQDTATSDDQKSDNERPKIGGIAEEEVGIMSKYDLDFSILDLGNRLGVSLSYAACLFKKTTAVKILELYHDILRQVLENEHILLKDIKVTTDFLIAKPRLSKDIDFNF